ncbi:unnamed protein product [marine sediment metagenome]|uniref:Uncharacterized protein n=1 Tax=marine sediment metagenome TaxID=412755 RepID=X1IX79_9ZZZZ
MTKPVYEIEGHKKHNRGHGNRHDTEANIATSEETIPEQSKVNHRLSCSSFQHCEQDQ